MMFDQPLPFDEQAEESVLAALLLDPDAIAKVQPIVSAPDFFREHHGWIFEACLKLWESGEGIDQVTVAHELDRVGHLDDVGGLVYLSDLVLNLPTAVGVEHWAAIVKRDAMYRRMIGAAVRVADLGYRAPDDYEKSLAQAEQLIYELRAERKDSTDFRHLSEFLEAYGAPSEPDEAPARTSAALYAIRTGLRELDAVLGGLRPGQLIVVGAETGMGKTGLVNGFARNAAVTQNASVAVFSMEMTGEQLAMRMLASEARINSRLVARQDLTEEQWIKLFHALAMLDYADIYIDTTARVKPGDIHKKCLKLAKERGLDLLIIDHLQIMEADRPTGREVSDLTSITQALKALALTFNIPVVLCSQLNRANNGSLPSLRDLRGSGSIEQDADVVLFLFRAAKHVQREEWEKTHTADQPYPVGMADLLVAKQRDGDDNVLLRVRYRAAFTRFEDFDPPAGEHVQGVIPDFMRAETPVGYH